MKLLSGSCRKSKIMYKNLKMRQNSLPGGRGVDTDRIYRINGCKSSLHTYYLFGGEGKKTAYEAKKNAKFSVILYLVYNIWKEWQDGVLRINRQVHGGDKKNWIRRLRSIGYCRNTKSLNGSSISVSEMMCKFFGSLPSDFFLRLPRIKK